MINPINTGAVSPGTLRQTDAPVAPSHGAGRGAAGATVSEGLSFSDGARAFAQARAAVARTPDVRASVVADLRQRIGSGTYQVQPRELARSMLMSLAG